MRKERTEAFSDAVFAIALTLLVLELRPPEAGRFAELLLAEWPAYLAYLTAFLTIATIWLNHHSVMSCVAAVDPPTLLLNLGLLLGTSLVPWPTALISAAARSGDRSDETAAVIVYAVVTVMVSVPWALLSLRLSRHPELLATPAARPWLRRNGLVSTSALGLAAVGAGVGLVSPLIALLLFFLSPFVFLVVNVWSSSWSFALATSAGGEAGVARETSRD